MRRISIFAIIFLFGLPLCENKKLHIDVVKTPEMFTEDKITTFVAYPRIPTEYTRLVWVVKTKNPIRTIFYKIPHIDITGIRKLSANNTDRFHLRMRRDFSGLVVYCFMYEALPNVTEKKWSKATYDLPTIKHTIPVNDVVFGKIDFVILKPFRLWCDVKTNVSIREVYIDSGVEYTPSKRNWPLDNGWQRYEITSKVLVHEIYDGERWQCIAETQKLNSNIGNVMSKITTIIVHFSEFLRPVKIKKSMIIFEMRVNPRPNEKDFTVQRITTHGSDAEKAIPVRWCHIGNTSSSQPTYEIFMKIAIDKSGTYKVLFKTEYLSASSPSFNVTVHHFSEFLGSVKIEKSMIIIKMRVNPRPNEKDFTVQRITKRSSDAEKAIPVRWCHIRNTSSSQPTYEIFMKIAIDKSGTYKVFFRTEYSSASSPSFSVHRYNEHAVNSVRIVESTSAHIIPTTSPTSSTGHNPQNPIIHKPIIIPIVICFVIVALLNIIPIIVIIYCRRKRIIKTSQEMKSSRIMKSEEPCDTYELIQRTSVKSINEKFLFKNV